MRLAAGLAVAALLTSLSPAARALPACVLCRTLARPDEGGGSDAPAPALRSVAWAFVPFGVGQFANDQPLKGSLFFAGEVAAFGTFAATFGALEGLKVSGQFGRSGQILSEDMPRARALQTTYLIAFWTGVALAAVGVVDAVASRPALLSLGPGAVAVRF